MTNVLLGEPQFEPVVGADAFREDSADAIASRAAHYLGMSIYSFGASDAAADILDDADALETPQLAPLLSDGAPLSQAELDELTRHHIQAFDEAGDLDVSHRDDDLAANLFDDIGARQDPEVLLSLLNLRQRSSNHLEAAAAASGLLAYSAGALELSREVLQREARSEDKLASAVALASLADASPAEEDVPDFRQAEAPPEGARDRRTAVSTTVHGTWALLEDAGWYKPGADMHDLLLHDVTDDLWDRPMYFRWSGALSEDERRVAATDMLAWRTLIAQASVFDVVFAHSHGGNVALNAAAEGATIRLLVLMHTPAIHRSKREWAMIRRNVKSVIVMRTRFDLVVAADSLHSAEGRQHFNPQLLPHFPVVRGWTKKDAWFSHSFYVTRSNWEKYELADLVRMRLELVRGADRGHQPPPDFDF